MDLRLRRSHSPEDRRECLPRNDVQPGKGQDGEDQAVADHKKDAEGSSATRSYGRYGGL